MASPRDFAMPPMNSQNTGLKPGDALVVPAKSFKHCVSCNRVLAPSEGAKCGDCMRVDSYLKPQENKHQTDNNDAYDKGDAGPGSIGY